MLVCHLCLSPFFQSRFKVCPHITLLSYACVQKSTRTHPRPLFTNTAAPFSQPSRCECPLVRVLLPVKSLIFFYQPPSQALNRKRKSREFGSRRDQIKLKQWVGVGWGHSCSARNKQPCPGCTRGHLWGEGSSDT